MDYTQSELIVLPITLLIIVSLSLIIYYLLRNKNDKIKNTPFAVIAIVIIILELLKQYISYKDGTYSAATIPLHFCSLFLFFFPIATLIPNKKIKTFGSTMSLICCVWMTIIFYISPRIVISDAADNILANFYTFHTFTYHHLVILYLILGILLNQFKVSSKFYIDAFIGMTTYTLIAIPLAHILNYNYCNILFSNIGILENLRISFGQVPYTILLYLAGLSGAILTCFIYRKVRKIS